MHHNHDDANAENHHNHITRVALQSDAPITNEHVSAIDEISYRKNRGRWWRATIRSYQQGCCAIPLTKSLQVDFSNGTTLGAFVAGIAFTCVLEDVKFQNKDEFWCLGWIPFFFGVWRDPWLAMTTEDWVVSLGKIAYPASFMLAIIYTTRCIYASCLKQLMFLTLSPAHTVETMKAFLEEDDFGEKRWYHLSPVFLGIKYNMVGICVGVLFNYGVIPFSILVIMCVLAVRELDSLRYTVDKAMESTFDRCVEHWNDQSASRANSSASCASDDLHTSSTEVVPLLFEQAFEAGRDRGQGRNDNHTTTHRQRRIAQSPAPPSARGTRSRKGPMQH